MYEINGPFFFGAAEKFKDTLSEVSKKPKVLIVRMRNVPAIDSTAMHALRDLVRRTRKDGTLVLCPTFMLSPSSRWAGRSCWTRSARSFCAPTSTTRWRWPESTWACPRSSRPQPLKAAPDPMHLQELLIRYGLLAVFLGAAFEGDFSLILAGVVAHLGIFPFPHAIAAGALGSLMGDSIWFGFGRLRGTEIPTGKAVPQGRSHHRATGVPARPVGTPGGSIRLRHQGGQHAVLGIARPAGCADSC